MKHKAKAAPIFKRKPCLKARLLCLCLLAAWVPEASAQSMATPSAGLTYPIVHSGLVKFYDAKAEIPAMNPGQAFYGQDASYLINPPSYRKNADGSVTDLVTGLTWESDMGQKMTLEEAQEKASASRLGGYSDWRVPTIKELYSLILFTGTAAGEKAGPSLFIDTRYFKQPIGDASKGEREIDAQTWSSTVYVGKTMANEVTIFGLNFVDGRIKGYPKVAPRTKEANRMYFRLVRGNSAYGLNRFVDNGDGSVSDLATGLMWQKADSGKGLDWQSSLAYAEGLKLAGHDDWRLPSAKELESIVDYTKAPSVTGTAAIDAIFSISSIVDPLGGKGYPYFWTATTFLDGMKGGAMAVYLCFGQAWGKMGGNVLDVHGAGSQRSDPKSGNPSDYPQYFGPQGDLRYVFNYARCVRSIK